MAACKVYALQLTEFLKPDLVKREFLVFDFVRGVGRVKLHKIPAWDVANEHGDDVDGAVSRSKPLTLAGVTPGLPPPEVIRIEFCSWRSTA